MKKKECPSCAMQIDADSKVCPICQYEFVQRPARLKWTAIILIILFLLYLLLT
jgi:RNA polymerase subunit RPABC4/transcription elongation factor Spt4